MKAIVFTSDRHDWLLHGFLRQWSKYRGTKYDGELDLEIAGFSYRGPYRIEPSGEEVPFSSIGRFEDYPVERWSDAVYAKVMSLKDELFIFMLEDYWLMRHLNRGVMNLAEDYMRKHPDVIRFDLTSDRMFAKEAKYTESHGVMDICEAKGDYSLSFQAAIYRRDLLLEVLRPGETPWQAELRGTQRLNNLGHRVLGSYQWPVNYMIVVNKGKLDTAGRWMWPARTLDAEDWADLAEAGCLEEVPA